MLDVKVKGLFDVLNLCIGVNGNELETAIQLEISDLDQDTKDQLTKVLNDFINRMPAGELIRKLSK
jgi:hypothetical protein